MRVGVWGDNMPTAKEHAIDLYMTGIRDGNAAEALDRNIGARYAQHSTGVADGKEGFLEFFVPFLERNPVRDMQIKRALQDGSKVFVHCHQNLNNGQAQWVTMDFFDSDYDGKIIEHWDVITEYDGKTASGRTSVDGPTEITDLDKTEANKAVVRRLITEGVMGRDMNAIRECISDKGYAQHGADMPDGVDAVVDVLGNDDLPLSYDELFMMVGEGNFVATMCRITWEGQPHCQADLFRLEDGKIVEHWDAGEAIGPVETWNNSGKF